MARDCLIQIAAGCAVGGAIGGAVGAVYGTYEAVRFKVPGLLKIRHIGRATMGSAALFGLGAWSAGENLISYSALPPFLLFPAFSERIIMKCT